MLCRIIMLQQTDVQSKLLPPFTIQEMETIEVLSDTRVGLSFFKNVSMPLSWLVYKLTAYHVRLKEERQEREDWKNGSRILKRCRALQSYLVFVRRALSCRLLSGVYFLYGYIWQSFSLDDEDRSMPVLHVCNLFHRNENGLSINSQNSHGPGHYVSTSALEGRADNTQAIPLCWRRESRLRVIEYSHLIDRYCSMTTEVIIKYLLEREFYT